MYLVTGGAGFIGSHLTTTLIQRGEHVRVFDNFSTGRAANLAHITNSACAGQLEIIRGDIRDRAALHQALQGVEVVFHEAADASVPHSVADPETTLQINVVGTQEVLLAARNTGVRRVVFASSCAIYGDAPAQPKREDHAPAPLTPYAVHKLTGEHLCASFTRLYGLETVALRYFNVFGPRQDPKSEYAAVIPRFLTALRSGEAPTVYGDGEQTRDFIAVGDIVAANLLAASSGSHTVGQVFNVGSGTRTSLNGILDAARTLLGADVSAHYTDPRPGDIRDSLADISRAHDMLGFTPSISLRAGLALTLEALTTPVGHIER